MNKTNNHIETVFREVKDHFADIPRITITPGEGNPPEQYSINYQITGVCKEPDGDVYSCENHVISISLPFGFPHFPPNCLPESLTFHPDFDSSAICIGDIWEAEKSIVKLILHIGRMISGEIYSESNAFNQEAAEWYSTNRDQLPFDKTDFAQLTQIEFQTFPDEIELDAIDTLDDNDFGQSLSLASGSSLEVDVDTDRLRIMAKQKRFQAISREFKILSEQFNGRTALEKQVQTAMDEATTLFHEANELEHQGEQQKALDKYQAVEELVSDYPLLHESKERVQQAFDLLGDWVSNEPKSADPDGLESNLPPAKKDKRTFFEDKKAVSRKLFYLAAGLGSLALIATLIFSYFSLGSNLKKAGKRYEECQNLLDQNNFRGAEQKCEEALSLIAEVQMVRQGEKEQLAGKIQTLLASPKLRQGLLGKTLFDGKYVSKSTKEQLIMFKEAAENGDSFFKNQRWYEATLSYKKALAIAAKTAGIKDDALAEIRKNLPLAQFNSFMQSGKKALAVSDWENATKQFSEALKLAKTNPHVLPENLKQLERLASLAKFNTLNDKGHAFFASRQWNEALNSFQNAMLLLGKFNPQEVDTLSDLKEKTAKTKIYMAIEKGKEAFAAARWDEVIAQYEKAILLLEENSKLLSKINTSESREKLSRILLHAEIIRDKQDLAKYLKSEEYDSAVEKMQSIKETITASKFAAQPEFKTILNEITSQIKDTKKQSLILKQTTYLIKNFEDVFLKHYPAAFRSALSSPKVVFLKHLGSKLLFRMQCTETASGSRPLRLQMDYLYNPSNGRWRFYSEE
ncbi:MAG TPA: hypothetical protein EYP35_05350 [Desulfobacterales bacterium]|nr:hypothetical protein [Desulfobacterales bacterium]HIP39742.1 hypothetical protein [Desulfocapsa sulfexigens]